MFLVLAAVALGDGDFEGVDEDGAAEAPGEQVAAELAGVVDAEYSFALSSVDGRGFLLGDVFEGDCFF